MNKKHSLCLVPRNGFANITVGEEMWAVPDLNVNDSFLGFVLNKLVSDPLYGVFVATEMEKAMKRFDSLTISNLCFAVAK